MKLKNAWLSDFNYTQKYLENIELNSVYYRFDLDGSFLLLPDWHGIGFVPHDYFMRSDELKDVCCKIFKQMFGNENPTYKDVRKFEDEWFYIRIKNQQKYPSIIGDDVDTASKRPNGYKMIQELYEAFVADNDSGFYVLMPCEQDAFSTRKNGFYEVIKEKTDERLMMRGRFFREGKEIFHEAKHINYYKLLLYKNNYDKKISMQQFLYLLMTDLQHFDYAYVISNKSGRILVAFDDMETCFDWYILPYQIDFNGEELLFYRGVYNERD